MYKINIILLSYSYCGPDPPKFDKSDFEKGKVRHRLKVLPEIYLFEARWLVFFNNTGNDGSFSPKISIEAPTIGYRSQFHKYSIHSIVKLFLYQKVLPMISSTMEKDAVSLFY